MKINLYKKFYKQLNGLKSIRKNHHHFKVINIVNSMFNKKILLNIKKPFFFPKEYEYLMQNLIRQNLMHFSQTYFLDLFKYFGDKNKLRSIIPREYSYYLKRKYNIETSKIFSVFYLFKLSLIYFSKSLRLILHLIFDSHKINFDVIFFNTPLNCYNQDPSKYNLINWYRNYFINKQAIKEKILIQNTSVKRDINYKYLSFHKNYNFGGTDFYLKIKFLFSIIIPFFSAIFSIITLKWWNTILFFETISLNYIKLIHPSNLPDKFFFNNSIWYYKPLFANYLETLNNKSVFMLFYSANMENFLYKKYKKENHFGYNQIDFKKILVWDNYQKKYIKKYNKKAEIEICNYIDFIENKKHLNIFNPKNLKIISVFDIHPSENILINMFSGYDIPPYYSNEVCLNFLKDVAIAASDRFLLLYKSKRLDTKKTNQNHFNIKKKNIIKNYYHELHPEISPRRIIEVSDACISIPFTSTALISKFFGKPTIFYDSKNLLKNKIFHDIKVLNNTEQLKNWIDILDKNAK